VTAPARGRPSALDSLLTPEEVAERLRTSPRFVRRLNRRAPDRLLQGRQFIRIAAADVDAFIAAGRVEPGASYVRPGLRFGNGRRW
jgi:hypothetical protein